MERRLKHGLKDAWWFWRNLPESIRFILNLGAFIVLGVIAALWARDYPPLPQYSSWFNLGLYWLAAWLIWQPLKILETWFSINLWPRRVEELKAWLEQDVESADTEER